MSPRTKTKRVLELIATERNRQRDLLVKGAILYDCADAEVCMDKKLRTATEELGEIARAIDAFDKHGEAKSTHHFFQLLKAKRAHLKTELIQLAAVATAWAESIEEDPA